MEAVIAWVMAHGLETLGAIQALLMGVIAVSLLIPGEQPEKALKAIADVLSKLSRK